MRLLLLSLALTCVSAATVNSRCAWGPPFWCSSVEHARECNAVAHCLGTVWKYSILQPQTGGFCTECQLVVNQLKDLLSDKPTEEEIASLAAKACAVLSNPDFQDQCKGIILEYTPELLQMLVSKIKSQVICATIDLCPGLEDRVSPYGEKVSNDPAAPNSPCEDCTKFFQDVQQSITSNETLNELLQLLNQTLCSRLDSLAGLCMDFLKDNLPIGLQILADQLDPALVCRVFGFCQGDVTPRLQIPLKNIFKADRQPPLQYKSSEECDICKQVMNQLVEAIRDKVNQEKVINEVETLFCGALGGLKDTCKQLVEEYAPAVFELLVNELDPNTFCEYVGMCPVPTLYKPVVQEPARSEMMSGYVQDSLECTLCKEFMQEVDNLIENNQTLATVEDLVEQVCKRLSSEELVKQCSEFVLKYGPVVFELLKQELDPKVFCFKLGLCQARVSHEVKEKLQDDACDLCVLFVKEVEAVLANVSADEIISDMKMACSYLPVQEFKDKCNQYVDQYGKLVVGFLKSGTDPHVVCALISLCNETRARDQMTKPIPEDLIIGDTRPPPKVSVPVPCEICDTVVYYIKILLENNATEAEILSAMEELCGNFGSFADMCKSLVTEYGPKIIELLQKELDPGKICGEIGLCPGIGKPSQVLPGIILSPLNTLPLQKVEEESKADKVSASTKCEICNTIVFYVKSLLDNNRTQEEALHDLEILCTKLGSFADVCKSVVDEYGPEIIRLLDEELSPGMVCSQLKLCTSQAPIAVISPLNTLPLQQKGETANVLCETCTVAMNVLKDLVGNRITEDGIASGLESLCNDLPAHMQGDCDRLVVTYEPKIIKYMVQKLGSGEICVKLGVCPARQLTSVPMVPLQVASEIKVSGALKCKACKETMKFVLNYIGENKTEGKIQEALDKVCSQLPSLIASECQDLVNKYSRKIIDFILLDYSADKICQELGLCSSMGTLEHVKLLKNKPVGAGSIECEVCEAAMDFVFNYIGEDKTEAKIKEALDKVCRVLPAVLVPECQALVNEFAQQIIELILKDFTADQICQQLGLCTSTKQVGAGSIQCEMCETVTGFVLNYIGENKTEAKIKEALDKVCSILPATLVSECQAMVNQYAQQIIDLILKNFTDDQICQMLGLCTSTAKVEQIKLLKDKQVGAGSVECEMCEAAMKFVFNYIGEDKTEAKIKEALDKVCSILPAALVSECQALVNQYAQQIIDFILKDFTADQICQELGLCTSTVKFEHVKLLKNKQGVSVEAGPGCAICEFVMSELDEILKENATEEEVRKALEYICTKLPSSLTEQCKSFVDEYTDLVVKLIAQGLKPDQICKELHLCSSLLFGDWKAEVKILPPSVEELKLKGKDKAGPFCAICEFVMKTVENELQKNQSQAEIEKILEDICSKMPATIADECDSFIKQYAPIIVNLLLKEVDPDKICQEIGLCTTLNLQTPKGYLGSAECTICEFVLNELEQILGENKTEEEIRAALDKVCSLLPATISEECQSFVNKYTDAVIQMLLNEVSPSAVCTLLGLCQSEAKLEKLKTVTVRNDLECDLCKVLCQSLEVYLHQNKTEKQIELLLEQLCDALPDTVTVQCRAEVRKYAGQILLALQNDMDPNIVCPTLQLCQKSYKKPQASDDKLYFRPHNTQLLGTKKCTQGPAFWCATKQNALRCNAVEHCMRHVWRK